MAYRYVSHIKVRVSLACRNFIVYGIYCGVTECLQEEHGNPIFGVKFNELLDDEGAFATVGSNRVHSA